MVIDDALRAISKNRNVIVNHKATFVEHETFIRY